MRLQPNLADTNPDWPGVYRVATAQTASTREHRGHVRTAVHVIGVEAFADRRAPPHPGAKNSLRSLSRLASGAKNNYKMTLQARQQAPYALLYKYIFLVTYSRFRAHSRSRTRE